MNRREKRIADAHRALAGMLREMLTGKFAPIRLTPPEIAELCETIADHQQQLDNITKLGAIAGDRLPTIELSISEGAEYIKAEAPQLDRVPFGWITDVDIDHVKRQRETARNPVSIRPMGKKETAQN